MVYPLRCTLSSTDGVVQGIILKPFDIAFSKTAQKAYLTTFLVGLTGTILLGFAITAYILFYWSYIPRIGFERAIHLQFDNVYNRQADSRNGIDRRNTNPYPYGTINLSPDIVGVQRYDIVIELTLPRTPENKDAGNFMLEATMYAPDGKAASVSDRPHAPTSSSNILALSRRAAILPYRSTIIELVYKFTELHWYLLNWRQEADHISLLMFEGLEFPKGWRNVPSTMKVEVQSTHRMQLYTAKASFHARFHGLRWLMYNHRMVSAIIFIGTFWATEMIFAGLAWAAISLYVAQPASREAKAGLPEGLDAERVKYGDRDEEDQKLVMSDTERTFPTYGRQQALRYEDPNIKQEYEGVPNDPLPEYMGTAAEADDEDEDADFFLDSGIGTSMDSNAARRASVRKRKGREGDRDE